VNQDAERARAIEHFAELCDAAATLGLRAVLEFIVFSVTKTLDQADRMVAQAANPSGGVLVDPLHLQRSGGSPAQLARHVAANPARYPYAQICDAPLSAPRGGGGALYREAVEDRLAPGDGELPLLEVLAALPPDAALSVEAPVRADFHLTPTERARRVMGAVRRLLDG
jgi:sugar phosphate isomerase/epimerase